MNKLYTRLALVFFGLTFSVSVLVASGCGNRDIQPGANSNYEQHQNGKKLGLGQTE